MLILTRGLGQGLLFEIENYNPEDGSQMEVVILGIDKFENKDVVKIGIRAPDSIKISRSESFYKKKRIVKSNVVDEKSYPF